jgi:ATP-dependent DNA ligase
VLVGGAEVRRVSGALLLRYDGRCVVHSRRGTDLSSSFPDLVTAAVGQVPDETILDGEVVVGIDGRLEFAELQKRLRHRSGPARWRGSGRLRSWRSTYSC